MKRFLSKLKKCFLLLYFIGILLLFAMLLIVGTGIIGDKKLLQGAVTVNSMALIIALLSLPGIAVQLIEMALQTKEQYKFDGKCPNCRQLIQLKLTKDE